MRLTGLLGVLGMLAGCGAADGPVTQAVVLSVGEGGDATGRATQYGPWPGPGALDARVIALLPKGVTAQDVRFGSDGCYYYQSAAGVVPVRWDDDPAHFYCIG